MAYEFKLPDLGEGIHEGEIKKWLIKEGDSVQADQPMAEFETDKAVVEMPCPKSGIVLKLLGKEGERVKVGQVVVVIGTAGERWEPKAAPPAAARSPLTPSPSQSFPSPPRASAPSRPAPLPSPPLTTAQARERPIEPIYHETHGAQAASGKPSIPTVAIAEPGHVMATPYVRKLAREMGMDLSRIKGSGPGGRISEEDVKKAKADGYKVEGSGLRVEETTPPATSVQPLATGSTIPIIIDGDVERVPFKGVRRKVAEHMVTSMHTAMHVTHVDEVDVTELAKVREREKAVAQQQGVHLTYLPFIVKACVAALHEFPQLNASLDEEKQEIVLKKYFHIGIAVDTDEGLMVPVIKEADKKNRIELAKEITELAEKAKTRTLTLEQMRGGSFTITNIGSVGGLFATPIINYPEVAILGLYRMQDRPVVHEGLVVVRKMLTLSLTFDHRVIDGALAARFMNSVKRHLEDPETLGV